MVPIQFYCECGKKLSAPAYTAGREGKCSACKRTFVIPGTPPPSPQEAPQVPSAESWGRVATVPYRPNPKTETKRKAAPKRLLRDYTYLVLLLALIPLIYTSTKPEDAGERLEKTLQQASPELRAEVDEYKEFEEINGPLPDWALYYLSDEFYDQLPGRRVEGAMLSRRSKVHWLFAIVTLIVFLGLILTFFAKKSAEPRHLLYVAGFTGTVGIVMLLVLQALADATRGWIVVGGISTLPFWLLKLVAGSYDAAIDPNANLFVSAFGFIACVGLLEESVKVLPIVYHYHTDGSMSWRGAMLWGLASGIGFGVTEGIMYSGDYYNGIWAGDVYLTRFISCVTLHAVWSASAALFVFHQRDAMEAMNTVGSWISGVFGVVIIPMFLHGIFDTLLKKEMEVGAIVLAALSFGVLALQIEVVRKMGVRRKAVAGW
jgi:RsiW-degrading membrane proteinase PrsW (M82 family)